MAASNLAPRHWRHTHIHRM